MIFTKEELSFISIFAKCADNRQIQNDKFRIKTSVEKQEVVFSQFSEDIVLIKTLSKKVEDDFEVIFPVNQFVSLINTLPDNGEIDIKHDGITFNGNRYEFESIDLSSVFNATDSYRVTEYNEADKVIISDFLNTKNSFMGIEGFSCTLLAEGNFISAPNDNALVCSYKTSNDKDVIFYIPKLASLIGVENKINLMNFYNLKINNSDCILINVQGIDIIFNKKNYELPNICEEEFKSLYEFDNKIEFNKSVLKESLNRIKIFSQKNIYTRVRCSTTNNQFIIESKEPNSGYAVEKLEAFIDNDLQNKDKVFFVSQSDLSIAVNALKGDKIIIRAHTIFEDAAVIKVMDETENDFFLVRCIPE